MYIILKMILVSDKLLKKINKGINHDLKLLNIWLRANKISLNAITSDKNCGKNQEFLLPLIVNVVLGHLVQGA